MSGSSEKVTEAAEGRGGFRSCLIDHKGADIQEAQLAKF